MHPWAQEGVFVFNILMACVDLAGMWYVRRSRTAGSWWKAGLFAAGSSLCLVSLFAFGPSVLSVVCMAGYRTFPVVRLVAYVIFLHAPICMLGGAVLLRKAAPKTAILSTLAAIGILAVAVDAFWIEPTWLDVTHTRIASSKVKQPIRIAVVADIQTDHVGPYERRVLERVMAEKPDLILLAGDYIGVRGKPYYDVRKDLNALMKDVGLKAPKGVFAVQGNVDYWHPWRQTFYGLPVVAVHSTHSFDVGPIQLTCLSARHSFNPRLRLSRNDPNRFHVVLGHGPDYARGQIDADLLLAGHTHGGQVCFPFIGPLTTGCSVPTEWASGITELPSGAKLYVSRGVGLEGGYAPRIRFLCRPQILVIDLVPE